MCQVCRDLYERGFSHDRHVMENFSIIDEYLGERCEDLDAISKSLGGEGNVEFGGHPCTQLEPDEVGLVRLSIDHLLMILEISRSAKEQIRDGVAQQLPIGFGSLKFHGPPDVVHNDEENDGRN